MFPVIEAGLTVLALVLALTVPSLGSRWFEAAERRFGKLAQKRGLSVIVVGLSALALRTALLPILPIPVPGISDEYGYLLLSDTFAHGRLTNPANPMWVHFETFQVMWQPTYTAKYWPAQGLIMAFGQALLGHPFWGVWLSVGLMCATITWMLQAWVGEEWALMGGSLAVIRFGVFSYWDNSYFGGAVAAIGGALVLGALPRIKQERRMRDALRMGLGFAILANSRPYEGLVFSLPIAVALFAWMLGKGRPPLSVSLRQVVLPICLLLGLTGAWMGYYNWRVTGKALLMPYQVSQAQYDPTPYFLWQHERPLPQYRHSDIKEWEEDFELPQFRASRKVNGVLSNELWKMIRAWLFFVRPPFTLLIILALVTLPYGFSWKDISAPARFLLLAFGTSVVGIGLEVYFLPHYAAPTTCLLLALILLAMRRVWTWRPHGKATGTFWVRSVPAMTFVLLLLRMGGSPLHLYSKSDFTPWGPGDKMYSTVGRQPILSELGAQPDKHLVVVRYSPDLYMAQRHENITWPPWGVFEWVYNSADIDSQKVIWAQDMGPAKNQELIDYYKNRHVWLLYADDQPPKLMPYSEAVDGQARSPAQKGR